MLGLVLFFAGFVVLFGFLFYFFVVVVETGSLFVPKVSIKLTAILLPQLLNLSISVWDYRHEL